MNGKFENRVACLKLNISYIKTKGINQQPVTIKFISYVCTISLFQRG